MINVTELSTPFNLMFLRQVPWDSGRVGGSYVTMIKYSNTHLLRH